MPILPLVIAPDPRLNQPSQAVKAITADIKKLAADMLETMYASNGIGLAAVQVGVHLRMIVVDVDWPSPRYDKEDDAGQKRERKPLVLINPEIIEASADTNLYNEGCLSFPDQYSEVDRPAEALVRFTDLNGKEQTLRARGILCTCIQHEIDHINGVVFVDHISKLKREMILKRLRKQKRQGAFDAPNTHSPHHDGAIL
jgi:peptide deformylase